MELITEHLHDGHVLSSFSCGIEALDKWLGDSAARGIVQDTGRTATTLSRTQARSLPAEVPAILLAKLALDTSLHGQGLGADLLIDALTRCVQAGQLVASRYVVVDAINEAAARFYAQYGFTMIPGTEPARLQRRLKDIAADLAGV